MLGGIDGSLDLVRIFAILKESRHFHVAFDLVWTRIQSRTVFLLRFLPFLVCRKVSASRQMAFGRIDF